jgi:hypothetical protein
MAEQKLFKDLELGVRELFRILIPGAYVVSVAELLYPTVPSILALTTSTAAGLSAAFFIGLTGYALRAHERWFPYFFYFEQQRARLNSEIARVTGESPTKDHVGSYKFFLETKTQGLSDRIHYFTSFYYMLVELSLFSALFAYFNLARALIKLARPECPRLTMCCIVVIAVVSAIQLWAQFAVTRVRTTRTRCALIAEPIALVVALVVMASAAYVHKAPLLSSLWQTVGVSTLLLCTLSYLFWRLGDKHWKQIIGEQIILVNVQAEDLTNCVKMHEAKPAAEKGL